MLFLPLRYISRCWCNTAYPTIQDATSRILNSLITNISESHLIQISKLNICTDTASYVTFDIILIL